MRKSLFILCLCSFPLAAIGCGDNEGGSGDGGDAGAGFANQDDVDALGDDVGDNSSRIDDAEGAISDLEGTAGDLDDRVTELEIVPDPISCSLEEDCIPDGLSLSAEGAKEIVTTLCEHQFDCCDDEELLHRLGPGIDTVKACVAAFENLVNRGQTPGFINNPLVDYLVEIAQSLNNARVVINEDGVKECAKDISNECYSVWEDEEEEWECNVYEDSEEYPCDLHNLVTGLQEEGQPCNDQGSIWECVPGHVCVNEAGTDDGICLPEASADDDCEDDNDCRNDANSLYCKGSTQKCTKRGGDGDDCAFKDATFEFGGPGPIGGFSGHHGSSNNDVTMECEQGLTCDPTTLTCVSWCAVGHFCRIGHDYEHECDEGLVCNATLFPNLSSGYGSYGYGVCSKPIAKGKECTIHNPNSYGGAHSECATGYCEYDDTDERYECVDRKKDLASCDEDDECMSGYCDGSICTPDCNTQDDDDWFTEEYDVEAVHCPDTHYCSSYSNSFHGNAWATPAPFDCILKNAQGYSHCSNDFECEGLCLDGTCYDGEVANDSACDSGFDAECANGFCDRDDTGDCLAFLAAAGDCSAYGDVQCGDGFCNNADTQCATRIANNGDCSTEPNGCADGHYCLDNGTTVTCVKPVADGGSCEQGTGDLPSCDDDLSCDCGTSGTGSAGSVCLGDEDRANGDCCNNDDQCASWWCADGVCADAIKDGKDCDHSDPAKDRCMTNSYCDGDPNYEEVEDAKGKCRHQGLTGHACDPMYNDDDCYGDCEFTHDQWLCDGDWGSCWHETFVECDGDPAITKNDEHESCPDDDHHSK